MGITLDESNTYSCFEGDRKPIIGTYRQMLALASFFRREFISVNGYNPIRIHRSNGKVIYRIIAHFGSPARTICTIERID